MGFHQECYSTIYEYTCYTNSLHQELMSRMMTFCTHTQQMEQAKNQESRVLILIMKGTNSQDQSCTSCLLSVAVVVLGCLSSCYMQLTSPVQDKLSLQPHLRIIIYPNCHSVRSLSGWLQHLQVSVNWFSALGHGLPPVSSLLPLVSQLLFGVWVNGVSLCEWPLTLTHMYTHTPAVAPTYTPPSSFLYSQCPNSPSSSQTHQHWLWTTGSIECIVHPLQKQ